MHIAECRGREHGAQGSGLRAQSTGRRRKTPCNSYVCSLKYLYKVIDLLFYLTGNDGPCCRSFEPVAEFIMSVR